MPLSFINGASIEAGGIPPADLSTGAPSWDSSGNLSFNSGYGSSAVAYGCRAWVNFNGTGTVAIRSSGNVTSITDNGTGDYTVNFTTAMPNANYSAIGFCGSTQAGEDGTYTGMNLKKNTSPATSSIRVQTYYEGFVPGDFSFNSVTIFR